MKEELKELWELEAAYRKEGRPESLQELLKRLDPMYRLLLRVQKKLSMKADNEFGGWRQDELYGPALMIQKDDPHFSACGECQAGVPEDAETCPFCGVKLGESQGIFQVEERKVTPEPIVELPVIKETKKKKRKPVHKLTNTRVINGRRVPLRTYQKMAKERRREVWWPQFPFKRDFLESIPMNQVQAIYLCFELEGPEYKFNGKSREELIELILKLQPNGPMKEGWRPFGTAKNTLKRKKNDSK